MDPRRKILSRDAADAWIHAQRSSGRTVGFTCGAFDLMHAGHADYLARARALCDRLLVAVNSDESIRRYKSPLRPINPLDQRQYLVASLEFVDAVTTLDEDRPLGLLQRWKPDLYFKGGDYAASSLRSGDAVRAYGGRVEVIPPVFPSSTSAIIDRIQDLSAHAEPGPASAPPPAGLALVDRDGTLIRDIPFLNDPDRVELLSGVAEGLAALQSAGLRVAIFTNQQGIPLGYSSIDGLIAVNRKLFRLLRPSGVCISRVYFCNHTAADACDCRKPQPGMVNRAMRDFAVPRERTWIMGDSESDMQAGAAAGCPTVYLGQAPEVACTFRAAGFAEAARWVAAHAVAREGRR
jgi:D-glycero-beta-D-manno-heptose 1-phosphate adenylyltransferase